MAESNGPAAVPGAAGIYAQGDTHLRRRTLTVSMALAGALLLAAPVNAATGGQLADERGRRGPTMVDSSGNGRNGTIGPTCGSASR